MEQLALLEEHKHSCSRVKKDTSSTFVNNMKLPVHRWFRYSAGFSAEWVEREISIYQNEKGRKPNIVDPFVGSGTVLIEADKADCASIGIESHPFISRVAKVKLLWDSDIDSFGSFAFSLLKKSKEINGEIDCYPELIKRCFPLEILLKLDQLKKSFISLKDGSNISKLTWLALTSILRLCSPVGTAQWQYILPNKKKTKFVDPYIAFSNRICEFMEDMAYIQSLKLKSKSKLIVGDMRNKLNLPKHWGDLLITSPPYANNYDYADAVRLELSFWGEVQSWGDLQTVIRPHLIRSCTQHITKLRKNTYELLDSPLLTPIKNEIFKICQKLDTIKEDKGGKKPYHTMIVAYFLDLAKIWTQLRWIMKPGSKVCFVIGDSAPYGVYVPVDTWLGELAIAAGFKEYYFKKIRDRNIKWKNRKHKVPLNEGHLWVNG